MPATIRPRFLKELRVCLIVINSDSYIKHLVRNVWLGYHARYGGAPSISENDFQVLNTLTAALQ